MRVLITGGAGFLGSHLCDYLVGQGHQIVCMDNFITGRPENIAHLMGHERFSFVKYNVCDYLHVDGRLDAVMHFASPASPRDYLELPIATLKVGALGTHKALGLAKAKDARFLLASTSEVYGDPLVTPQPESYWGNVNPISPRGVYDEAKRFAEAMTMAYHRYHGLDTRIVRIFNTFGPRMRINDGRVVSNFIVQALQSKPLTVYGDGSQTRSFCYVDDLVQGIVALLMADSGTSVAERNEILEYDGAMKYTASITQMLRGGHDIATSGSLFRKACFETVGGYDEQLPVWEDIDLAIRLYQRFRVLHFPKPLYRHRLYAHNASREIPSQRALAGRKYFLEKHSACCKPGTPEARAYTHDWSHYYGDLGKHHLREDSLGEARRCFWLAVRLHPFNRKAVLRLLGSYLLRRGQSQTVSSRPVP